VARSEWVRCFRNGCEGIRDGRGLRRYGHDHSTPWWVVRQWGPMVKPLCAMLTVEREKAAGREK
jgi:hypothetical protein